MLFSNKNKRLKTINATFTGLSQIASYIVSLKEKHGFETLAVKTISSKRFRETRCEFHDLGNDEKLREYFSDRSPNQIEDEIYATPFIPFEAKTDDDGFAIITKAEPLERKSSNETSRHISERSYLLKNKTD